MTVPAGIFAMNKSVANVCKLLDMKTIKIFISLLSMNKSIANVCKLLDKKTIKIFISLQYCTFPFWYGAVYCKRRKFGVVLVWRIRKFAKLLFAYFYIATYLLALW